MGYNPIVIPWLRSLAIRFLRRTVPPPDYAAENRFLKAALKDQLAEQLEQQRRLEFGERLSELIEARQMAGSGPWRVSDSTLKATDQIITAAAHRLEQGPTRLREMSPLVTQGATGDIELALQNVEWRREINLSWLEFSRWGIQQIILISRLHYVKNPWIQRAINIVSAYVFGRGVEVMSEDDDANDVLKDFFTRNKKILGQAALSDLNKRLNYDGQVFFVFFRDEVNTGKTTIRTIDATEVFEIITDPDDTDEIWFYHRKWTQRVFDPANGGYTNTKGDREAYYPALSYVPKEKPTTINQKPVEWETPVLHLKGGTGISKWHFDCPKAFAALDWAKAGRRWLEACATVRQALSQIAMTLTTKGGQQALEGAKQQLQTSVGPTSTLWDKNPPPVDGSTFASGPGTTLQAFNTKGAGGDPGDVAEYRAMVANVFEIPATWLGDYSAILATATTLDRPTELAMLEKQERWREVLLTIATFVLNVSQGAASGLLKEAGKGDLKIVEAPRSRKTTTALGGMKFYEAAKPRKKDADLELKVIFPAIREGDMPVLVKAIAEAMTLDNKGGQIVGIDEKVGAGLLYEQLGVEDSGDILDEQYPPSGPDKYDPSRTKEPLPAPVGKILPDPGGLPQAPGGSDPTPATKPVAAAERFFKALRQIKEKRYASTAVVGDDHD